MWQNSRNVWPFVVYSVSFLIGHTAPEDSEVVLDTVELDVGVDTFVDTVETPDEEAEGPVGTFEETPDKGVVELPVPLGVPDGDAVGTFVGKPDVGVVRLPVPLGITDGDPVGTVEETPDVGIVELLVPLGATDGEPVGVLEETPDVGTVELPVPLGETDGELRMIGPDRAGSLVGISGKVLALVIGLDDPLEVLAVGLETIAVALEGVEEPEEALVAGAVVLTETTGFEETAVPEVVGELEEPLEIGWDDVGTALLEDERIVAVLLVDNGMVALVGVAPLEADIVVVFTSEGGTPGVIVRMSKSVVRAVSSL